MIGSKQKPKEDNSELEAFNRLMDGVQEIDLTHPDPEKDLGKVLVVDKQKLSKPDEN